MGKRKSRKNLRKARRKAALEMFCRDLNEIMSEELLETLTQPPALLGIFDFVNGEQCPILSNNT